MSSALNPSVVKTALDDVFMQEFNYKGHPGFVDATSSIVFNQETSDRAAEIQEVFKMCFDRAKSAFDDIPCFNIFQTLSKIQFNTKFSCL